jgi:hypothetical protein
MLDSTPIQTAAPDTGGDSPTQSSSANKNGCRTEGGMRDVQIEASSL